MDNLRVPPAVSFAFEQVVSKVCFESKVDYDDRPFMARELQNHLESFWRRETEKGLSTDDAQEQALAAFGSVEDVARRLRQPLWRRIMFFESYRAERFIVFLCIAVVHGFFCYINDSVYKLTRTPADSNGYAALGYIINPIEATAALLILQWKPKNRFLRLLAWVRFIPSPLIFTQLIFMFVAPIIRFKYLLYAGIRTGRWDIYSCTVFTILIPLGSIAVACFCSELLRRPQRHQRAQAKLRAKY